MAEGIRAPNLPLGNDLSEFIGIETTGSQKSLRRFTRASVIGAMDAIIGSFQAGGGVIFTTKAQANANLNYDAMKMAWVVLDPAPANNGVYQKSGASGSGAWTKLANLPYSFYRARNEGAGTANAIKATNGYPMASTESLIVVNITDTNTSSPVTLSLNNGAPLTIKTASGNDISSGGLTAGMLIAGYIDEVVGEFRLITDQASAAIQAAAEAAQAAAEAARDVATGAMSVFEATVFATKTIAEAYTPDLPPDYIRLEGYATVGVGGALYKKATVEPTHAGKFSITLSDGVTTAWYENVEPVVRPQMFGPVGTADDTATMVKCASVRRPIFLPLGTYTTDDLSVFNDITGELRDYSIIKHKGGASSVAFQINGSAKLENLTIDGNKDNQTERTTAFSANGSNFVFRGVSFLNSVYSPFLIQDFVSLDVTGCLWRGMAYHSGNAGGQTMCGVLNASDKGVATFSGNQLINLGVASLSAPGGILATSKNISMIFKGNYFFRIGQGKAGNFIGCIDAYQEGIDNVIEGNIFEEICYSAAKLSSSSHNVVMGNVVNGFDSGDSSAIPAIVVAYRPSDKITQKTIVCGNIIGGTIGANKSGIEVYGADGYMLQDAIVSDNIVKVSGTALLLQWINNVKATGNTLRSSQAIAPLVTRNLPGSVIDLTANTILDTTTARGISVNENCAGAIVDISGAKLVGGATSEIVRIDGVALATCNGLQVAGMTIPTNIVVTNVAGSAVVTGCNADSNTTRLITSIGGSKVDANNSWNVA